MNDAYNGKRRKIISSSEVKLEELDDRTAIDVAAKAKFEGALKQYRADVLTTDDKHRHERGWSAAEQYGCGERCIVCADHFPEECPIDCQEQKRIPHFRCQKGECKKCIIEGYQAPSFELNEVDDDEVISYTLFTPHTRCNVHGGHYIQEFSEKPKYRCTICEGLSESVRKEKKAKIFRKKFRTRHSERFKDFIGIDGTYAVHLRKMFAHKYRVILLGKDHKKKHRYKHARMRDFIVKIERDFAERYSAEPDKEQQFQYFSKDTSLGMEGITVYLKPKGKDRYETQFYSILSTEKSQDGRIVYANTKKILNHLKQQLDGGTDIGGMSLSKGLTEILDDSDGCAEQYRCATALYMLHKLAEEENIIYDRGIDAEGHGKKDSDGLSGCDKSELARQFRGNVIYQEELLKDHKRSYFMCEMSDGNRIDFAEVCREVLANPARGQKVAPNKPRTEKTTSDKAISKRHYYIRKEGEAKFEGLKMSACGFEKGSGIKSMYNFRFERELNEKFAYCRFPCSCGGCYERLQMPTIQERYDTPRDTCYLWPIMEIMDDNGNPTGKGYNDWSLGWFETRSDCRIDQYHASKADTLRGIGETYSKQIVEGDFGAYCIADDPDYSYYVVEWLGLPWQATEDEEIEIGTESFKVRKDDWLCKGIWLEKLNGGRNWHTMTEDCQECVVRLETVLNANLNMRTRSAENPFNKRMKKSSVDIADARGAWRMSDDDHGFLMEESRNREEFNEYDEGMALEARQAEEEKMKWQQAPIRNGADESGDEDDG